MTVSESVSEVRAGPRIPTREPVNRREIVGLDGLRAVAALMVLTTHVAFHTGLVTRAGIGPVVSRLDLGVCVFFLLSGFLLYRPWARSAMTGRPAPATRPYLRKRFARVYPAYLVLVVVVLGLYPPVAPAPPDQWAAYLTLTFIYFPGMAISQLGQTWSVATEVAFYAILPLLGWAAGRHHRGNPDRSASWQLSILGGMCLVSLVYHLVRSWTGLLPDWLSSFWLPGFLDWFAGGMALAVVQSRLSLGEGTPAPARYQRLRAMAHDANTSLIVAGLCFAIACTPVAGKFFFDGGFGPDKGGPWAILVKHYLFAGCAFFLLLPLVLGSADHWYARAMSSPLMSKLGTISYGIFLWHLLLVSVLADLLGLGVFQGGFWILWPLTIAATVLIAGLSWRLLERPILRWAHRGAPIRQMQARQGRAQGP